MSCRIFRNEVSEYLDGRLTDTERRRFLDHLATCTACRNRVNETRSAVDLLRSAEPSAIPVDFVASTVLAMERAARPSLAIVDVPAGRRIPRFDVGLGQMLRRYLIDNEFQLISYGVGVVMTCLLAFGTLNALRPVMALAMAGKSPTIWITVQESEAMGLESANGSMETVAYTIPSVVREGDLAKFAATTSVQSGEFMVLADVAPDGRATIVEVLSGPSDPQVVARLETALVRPTFVPARGRSGRAVASRVVLLVQQVDVVG